VVAVAALVDRAVLDGGEAADLGEVVAVAASVIRKTEKKKGQTEIKKKKKERKKENRVTLRRRW
jgi:hypothetical protein